MNKRKTTEIMTNEMRNQNINTNTPIPKTKKHKLTITSENTQRYRRKNKLVYRTPHNQIDIINPAQTKAPKKPKKCGKKKPQ